MSTTAKMLVHVADLPEAEEVAVQEMATPLLAYAFAIDTLPSALTVQPEAPAGQLQATAGGEVAQGSWA